MRLLPFVIFTLVFSWAHAQERAGEMSIDEIMVQPTYSSIEAAGGDFSFGSSSFSLLWNYENRYRARLSLGGNGLRPTPRIYDSADPTDQIDFYEAYGEYDGFYGRFRFGLLPLNFGHGGGLREAQLVFQRAHIYSSRIIALRDFGISFYTENKGYYTELVAHNGELDASSRDGEVWATVRWGYDNQRDIDIQMSAQSGRTTTDATAAGASGLAGFDATENSLWRYGSFSVHWYPKKWDVVLQSTYGEREQKGEEGSFNSHQFDAIHMVKNFWGLGLRYETYDPNRDIEDDGFSSTSLAVVAGSKQALSRVFLIATKKVEEGKDVSSDEFRLVWRLTPYF